MCKIILKKPTERPRHLYFSHGNVRANSNSRRKTGQAQSVPHYRNRESQSVLRNNPRCNGALKTQQAVPASHRPATVLFLKNGFHQDVNSVTLKCFYIFNFCSQKC